MGLSKGDKLPDFNLTDQYGEEFNSKEYRFKGPLVIYFYPKDFTPGCTKEACDFRDRYQDLEKYGATVMGISHDNHLRHARFSKKYDLNFKLLSDKGKVVSRLFGVRSHVFGLLPGRETFVFDKDRTLVARYESMNAASHISKVIETLKKL